MKEFAVEELPAATPYSKEVFDELGMSGINCGCGRFLRPACLNVDRLQMADGAGNMPRPGKLVRVQVDDGTVYYMQHDLEKAFPLPDAAFDWGYSEHFIEHVSSEQAIDWLAEMRRIIKPGGLLRLTTPDLRKYMEGYLDPEGAFF
jgi:SAM-dependent methyltransferase